jgi:pyridoxine 5-phosphate synthase
MSTQKLPIQLGVNIDHIATLRQVRGATTTYPDLLKMAKIALRSGASQITIHLREDRRHIQLSDLVKMSRHKIPLNLEMAAEDSVFKLALKYKPQWVCIVPEKREELTTEGGLNVQKTFSRLKKMIPKLQKQGIKVSLFIDPEMTLVRGAYDLNADAVEFHTGHWVLSQGFLRLQIWKKLVFSARLAHELGLRVHAGHGLDLKTTKLIKKLPYLQEVNIGHSIICYSIEQGLKSTVESFVELLDK